MRARTPLFVFVAAVAAAACSDAAPDADASGDQAEITADSTAAKEAAATLSDLVGGATNDDADPSLDPLARLSGEIATLHGAARTFHVVGVRPANADPFADVPVGDYAVIYDDGMFVYTARGAVAWLAPDGDQAALDAANELAQLHAALHPSSPSIRPQGVPGEGAVEQLAEPIVDAAARAIVAGTKAALAKAAPVLKEAASAAESFIKAEVTALDESSPVKEAEGAFHNLFSRARDKSVSLRAVGTRVVGNSQDLALSKAAVDALDGLVSKNVYVGAAADDFVQHAPSRTFIRIRQSTVLSGDRAGTIQVGARTETGLAYWSGSLAQGTEPKTLLSANPGLLRRAASDLGADRVLLQSVDDVRFAASRLTPDAFKSAFSAESAVLVNGGLTDATALSFADSVVFPEFDEAVVKYANGGARASDDVTFATTAIVTKSHNGTGKIVTIVVHPGQARDRLEEALRAEVQRYLQAHGLGETPSYMSASDAYSAAVSMVNRAVRWVDRG